MTVSNEAKRRGRPRDEPSLVAALMRGTLQVAADPRAALTIDSVVAAAGTSKPRVYRYFPSAEAAFSRVLAELLEAHGRAQCEAIRGEGSTDERFARLHGLVASPTDEQRTLFRLELLAIQQAAADARLTEQVQTTDARVIDALRELFADVEGERGLLDGYRPHEAASTLWLLRRGCLTALLANTIPDAEGPAKPLLHFWRVITRAPIA